MWLQCTLRCFCVHDQFNAIHPRAAGWVTNQQSVDYLIKADIVDDFVIPAQGQSPPPGQYHALGLHNAKEVTIRHLDNMMASRESEDGPIIYPSAEAMESQVVSHPDLYGRIETGLDPPNHLVSCNGPMPTFQAPPPFTSWDYWNNNLYSLCASLIDGGNS